MARPLATYIELYRLFTGLEQSEYDAAVDNAAPEISLVNWGTLAAKAEDMLIGHLLVVANPTRWQAAMSFAKVRVDDRGYETTASSAAFTDNIFYREYKRLLGLVKGSGDEGITTNLEQNMSYLVQRPPVITESF